MNVSVAKGIVRDVEPGESLTDKVSKKYGQKQRVMRASSTHT